MKNTIIILACLILSSCATPIAPTTSGTPEEITGPNLQTDSPLQIVSITPTRIGNDEIRLRVKIARNGMAEPVGIQTQALSGVTSSHSTIAPRDQQGSIILRGKFAPGTAITVRVGSGKQALERTVSLKSVAATRYGGTHRQSLQLETSNLEPDVFAPTRIYANFRGSLCQVMVQGRGYGLYVCFNGPVRAGQVYPLIPSRGLTDDTASITYFQSTNGADQATGFWDSHSGFVTVQSADQDQIKLLLQKVKLEPASGFAKNAAKGKFSLEASTQIDDISNLPK